MELELGGNFPLQGFSKFPGQFFRLLHFGIADKLELQQASCSFFFTSCFLTESIHELLSTREKESCC
jgi:hypothetical protein